MRAVGEARGTKSRELVYGFDQWFVPGALITFNWFQKGVDRVHPVYGHHDPGSGRPPERFCD